jgi:hypothetical protein
LRLFPRRSAGYDHHSPISIDPFGSQFAEPEFSDANECFMAWRHWSTELAFGDMIATHGKQLNEYVHWRVEEGRKLTGPGWNPPA